MSEAHKVTARFRKPLNMMFVTSQTLQMPFGATADAAQSAADAFCTARASAAQLPGTYRAWLSTSTLNAVDKMGSADGWVRVDGKPVFERALMAKEGLYYSPNLDETGAAYGDPDLGNSPWVATGSWPDGTADLSNGNCSDWTSSAGSGEVADPLETPPLVGAIHEPCSGAYALYCVETDYTASVAPHATGRTAFLTTAEITPGGGRDAMDQLCQHEASSAGLGGQFLALVSTTTEAATSRFGPGAPWVRLDGVQIAAGPTDLAVATLGAELNVDTAGTYYYDFDFSSHKSSSEVWTGAALPDQKGTVASTCNDWTSTSGNGESGSWYAASFWWANGPFACTSASSVYCLQQ
jgi:hypothetical protein